MIYLLSILAVSPPFQGGLSAATAGYRVYRRTTPTGSPLLIAELDPSTLQYTYAGGSPSDAWLNVRAVTACGVEDIEPAAPRQVRVAFDASGDLVLPTPNAPTELQLVRYAGGGLKLRWRYNARNEAASPATFRVYVDDAGGGTASFDYATPDHTVTTGGARVYEQDLGTFADGLVVRAAVRAMSSDGAEETNTSYAELAADASAPDVPVIASANVEDA